MTRTFKKIFLSSFICTCTFSLTLCGINESQFSPINTKEQILALETKIKNENNPTKESLYYLELAKLYYQYQYQEKAFKTFLKALKIEKKNEELLFSLEENDTYQNALKIYLDINGHTALENTKQIIQLYAPIVEQKPHYYQLGFIVAAAFANQGDFHRYFDLFYKSYINQPHHYLAYKSKAVLHIKLFERIRPGQEKEIHRKAILDNLLQAAEIFPADPSLYKLMIVYSQDKGKNQIVNTSLNKIIEKNIIIPRADLEFFIQSALELDNLDLAERFLAKTREWYQFSRMINSAQQYISQKQQQTKVEK